MTDDFSHLSEQERLKTENDFLNETDAGAWR